MKLALSRTVAADPERVFEALVTPAILQRCIPGCESLVESRPDVYAATIKIGVAGLKGSYTGTATLTNKERPRSLTLSFDGRGSSGFARGSAALSLTPEAVGTRIHCDTDVQVGGLIAAVGSRLIEAAARKLAGEFFDRLAEELA